MLTSFKKIVCFVFDVDGVLTNGNLLIMPNGVMARTMNIKDGYALQLAVKKGFQVWIISGGNSAEVTNRELLSGSSCLQILALFSWMNQPRDWIVAPLLKL